MVDFAWTATEQKLINPVAQDGLGLTAAQRGNITVQQGLLSYRFNWHTGYHGVPGNDYVYFRPDDMTKKRDFPRVWVSGPNLGTFAEVRDVDKRILKDVTVVIGDATNQQLFVIACGNYNR